jgi:hypothetical protein
LKLAGSVPENQPCGAGTNFGAPYWSDFFFGRGERPCRNPNGSQPLFQDGDDSSLLPVPFDPPNRFYARAEFFAKNVPPDRLGQVEGSFSLFSDVHLRGNDKRACPGAIRRGGFYPPSLGENKTAAVFLASGGDPIRKSMKKKTGNQIGGFMAGELRGVRHQAPDLLRNPIHGPKGPGVHPGARLFFYPPLPQGTDS